MKKKCIIDKYDTVYGFSLYVVVNPEKKLVDDYFEWEDEENSSILTDDGFIAYTNTGVHDKRYNKQCVVVIFNRVEDNALEKLNTCAHEALHVVLSIMRSVDIPLSSDSEEAFAYLQGWVTEKIFKTASKV